MRRNVLGLSGSCFDGFLHVLCDLHFAFSLIAVTSGSLIMFYLKAISVFGPGAETAKKLSGSTSQDQLLIQTSNSFVGLLLLVVRFLLFMVDLCEGEGVRKFFLLKGCVLQWLFGGLTLREGWRIWPGIGLNRLLGILSWHFHGFFSYCMLGGRNMISLVLEKKQIKAEGHVAL